MGLDSLGKSFRRNGKTIPFNLVGTSNFPPIGSPTEGHSLRRDFEKAPAILMEPPFSKMQPTRGFNSSGTTIVRNF